VNVPANLVFDPRGSFVTPAGLLIPPARTPHIGMGQSAANSAESIAAAGASTTAGILGALAAATPAALASGIGAAVVGVIALGIAISKLFSGCGNTCVEATSIVNQAGPILLQNLQAYLSASVRTASLQAAALNNFTTTWNAIVAACGNPSLGTAGQNCISQRQQGACAYHTSPGGWQQTNGVWTYVYPGANGSGTACWNFFVGYHDPIANDPDVQPDTAAYVSSSSTSSSGISSGVLLFMAAFGLVYLMTEGS